MTNEQLKSHLTRKVSRLEKQLEYYKSRMDGREMLYTFHGGYNYGYVAGKLEAILTVLDELEVGVKTECNTGP